MDQIFFNDGCLDMPVFTNRRNKSKAEEFNVQSQRRELMDSKLCELSMASDEKVAPFITKLYEMLTTPALNSICSFDASGTTIQVLDAPAFVEEVLPQVFHEHVLVYVFIKAPLIKCKYEN